MGFLSSYFRKKGESDDVDYDETEEKEDEERREEEYNNSRLPRLPRLNMLTKGLTLIVSLAETEKILLTGRVAEYSGEELVIERKPGQFAFDTCDIGTTVHIRAYIDSTVVDIKGTVLLSNRIQFRVKDLRIIPFDEHRANFRLPVNSPACLFYEEDKHLQNAENCILVDISVGGACVESEYIHGEGEILRLKFQIDEYAPMSFLGQVIRVNEPTPGVFRYGFLFAQLNDQEITALTRMLFNVQVNNKAEKKRTEMGHW